ncbi:MAG: hypothetical protein KF841_02170 [Phycisphaerae bacterium]|nr:hypothetical protein [Phycisphaerae bacterium]
MGTVTSLLKDVRDGLPNAPDRLFAHIYSDLKSVARMHLARHRRGVLQATELVNAAYARLAAKEPIAARDRSEIFYIISRAMHDVLVERVRADLALKRGREMRRVPLIEISLEPLPHPIDFMDLHQALSELGAIDEAAAHVVLMKFYSGLTLEEIAEAMGTTFAVTRRHWDYAKAWLHERLAHP